MGQGKKSVSAIFQWVIYTILENFLTFTVKTVNT